MLTQTAPRTHVTMALVSSEVPVWPRRRRRASSVRPTPTSVARTRKNSAIHCAAAALLSCTSRGAAQGRERRGGLHPGRGAVQRVCSLQTFCWRRWGGTPVMCLQMCRRNAQRGRQADGLDPDAPAPAAGSISALRVEQPYPLGGRMRTFTQWPDLPSALGCGTEAVRGDSCARTLEVTAAGSSLASSQATGPQCATAEPRGAGPPRRRAVERFLL